MKNWLKYALIFDGIIYASYLLGVFLIDFAFSVIFVPLGALFIIPVFFILPNLNIKSSSHNWLVDIVAFLFWILIFWVVKTIIRVFKK
jgi:hypothetical protein